MDGQLNGRQNAAVTTRPKPARTSSPPKPPMPARTNRPFAVAQTFAPAVNDEIWLCRIWPAGDVLLARDELGARAGQDPRDTGGDRVEPGPALRTGLVGDGPALVLTAVEVDGAVLGSVHEARDVRAPVDALLEDELRLRRPDPVGRAVHQREAGLPLVGEPVEQHAQPAEQEREEGEDAEHRDAGAEDAVEPGRPRQRRLVRRRQVLAGEQRDRRVGVEPVGADRQVLAGTLDLAGLGAVLDLADADEALDVLGRLGEVHGEDRLQDVLLPPARDQVPVELRVGGDVVAARRQRAVDVVLEHVGVLADRQRGVGVADPVVVVAPLLHGVLDVGLLAVGGDLEVLDDRADVGVGRDDPVEEPEDAVLAGDREVHVEGLDDVEAAVLVDREVGLVRRDRRRPRSACRRA